MHPIVILVTITNRDDWNGQAIFDTAIV